LFRERAFLDRFEWVAREPCFSPLFLPHLFEQVPNLLVGPGKVSGYDLPNASGVDAMIRVGNDVAEPTHFASGQTPVPVFDLLREVRGGLTYNFQGPLDCVSEQTVFQKVF